jgi:hypothetical protein
MEEPHVNRTLTSLLDEVRRGDPSALSRLFAIAYDKLLEIARIQRRRQPSTETLNTTALVHEAFIKLFGSETRDFNDRAHFMGRRRDRHAPDPDRSCGRKAAAKRGAGQEPASFEEVERALASEAGFVRRRKQMRSLHSIARWSSSCFKRSERQARIVECRFFGGMVDRGNSNRARNLAGNRKARLVDGQAWLQNREIQRDLG